jgi:hypothetical protein
VISGGETPTVAEVVLGLLLFLGLFSLTIWLYRKNRTIMLGVVTVSTFFGLLLCAMLYARHAPHWIVVTTGLLTFLTGLSVLGFVAFDVFRWAREKTTPTANDSPAASKLGRK